MSDSDTQRTDATPKKAPKPYPRTVWGLLLWFGIALALIGYVSYRVYEASQRFKKASGPTTKREAHTTLGKLRAAEAAYRADHGVYLATTSHGEKDFYPAPGPEPQRRKFQPHKDGRPGWTRLAAAMPRGLMYCGYVVVAGPAGSLAKAGPRGRALLGNRPPATPWYYILTECIQGEGKVLRFATTSTSDKITLQK